MRYASILDAKECSEPRRQRQAEFIEGSEVVNAVSPS
jgi:hypothetical protein